MLTRDRGLSSCLSANRDWHLLMSERKYTKQGIGSKFLLIIASFVAVFSCVMLCFFWCSSKAQMEELIEEKTSLALQFDLAIRSYVSETIRPFAQSHVGKDVFIPEVMSTSFVARRVFDKVHQEFPDYIIKFSSDNPRNPDNQANPEELKIIDYFNSHPDAKQWSGKLKINNQEHVALFSARRMREPCLQCHGDPKDAPASLVARYGDRAGFHRPVGEIIALDTIAMPVNKHRIVAVRQTAYASLVMITGLILLVVIVYCTFQRLIRCRLVALATHFQNAAKQKDKSVIEPLKYDNDDEIGNVIESFNLLTEDLSQSTTSIGRLNREIVERKLVEQELVRHRSQLETVIEERTTRLRQSEERLELALWGAELGTWDWDVLSGNVAFNKQWAKILGYTAEEIDPSVECWKQLLHPEDLVRVMDTVGKNLEGETLHYQCEHRLRTKEGTWKWVLACGKVVERDQAGRALRHAGVHLDISDRKQAEEQLTHYHANLERLVAQRTDELSNANDSLKRQINERKQAESELENSREQLADSLEKLESVNHHLEQQTVVAKRMAIEAENANKAKSEFLANMSHEIRTPMNTIIGFGHILASGDLSDEHLESVNMIRESSYHLLRLINDILDFSKIEANQLEVEMIDCSLGRLMNNLESTMMPQAKEKSLDFTITAGDNLPATIRSDPYRLQQCLINLVSNALKFTEQGHVHVNLSLYEEEGESLIRFDIEDTGIGIPLDRQQVIFESFTQADGSTSRQYGGSGLGLTITKQLGELLGGQLALTSEPGKGSTFSLVIPTGIDVTCQPLLNRCRTSTQGEHTVSNKPSPQFSGTVLVAEDVEGNQRLMTLVLSKLGIEVVIAADGLQAVEKASARSFDLILMDMQMPNMSGYEAAREIRKREDGRQRTGEGGRKAEDSGQRADYPKSKISHVPIVALTANAMKGDDQTCRDAGCDGYLTKPINRGELLRVLACYLSSRQQPVNPPINQQPIQTPKAEPSGVTLGDGSDTSCQPLQDDMGYVINWEQLIERFGDEDLIREVTPTYAKDIRMHLDKLVQAVECGACQSIASHAHALKGVGRNLSIDRLFESARQMEQVARENDGEECIHHVTGLKRETENVLAVLSQDDWIEKAKAVCTA